MLLKAECLGGGGKGGVGRGGSVCDQSNPSSVRKKRKRGEFELEEVGGTLGGGAQTIPGVRNVVRSSTHLAFAPNNQGCRRTSGLEIC